MYIMEYAVIGDSILRASNNPYNVQLTLGCLDFFLLVFSTVLIAAAGYIINDYFDIKIDRVNKPDKVIVGKFIKKRVAMLWHTILNVLAIAIALYLSIKYGNYFPLIIHLFTTFGLWMYSLTLKRKFLSGNLTIAIMSALVVVLVGLVELPGIWNYTEHIPSHVAMGHQHWKNVMFQLIIFSSFAFLSTLIREIQKDLADMKGDEVLNCSTVPLVWGIRKTKNFISVLIFILAISILAIQQLFASDLISSLYVTILVIVPMMYSAYQCNQAKDRKGFLVASAWMKFSMFTGVLFAIFYS